MAVDCKCPRCNHKAPLVDYLAGAADGELAAVILQLPRLVQTHYLRYFSLFRPASGRAIQTQKAIRLSQELADLVKLSHVSQQGKVDRPCPPSIWAQAMERMIEQIHTLTLPMKSHGYLKTIAWTIADKADAQTETKQTQQQTKRPIKKENYPADPLQKIKDEWDKKHGADATSVISTDFVKGME